MAKFQMTPYEYFFNSPPTPLTNTSPPTLPLPNQFIRLLSTSRHGYAKFDFFSRVVSHWLSVVFKFTPLCFN